MNTRNAKKAYKDGWTFTQFPMSSKVIIAERKLKWYNEEEFDRLERELSKKGCRVFFDKGSDIKKYQPKTCWVEVYHKFKDKTLNNQVDEMLNLLKIIPI